MVWVCFLKIQLDYINIESLCCIPETDTIYNYIHVFIKGGKVHVWESDVSFSYLGSAYVTLNQIFRALFSSSAEWI